MQQESLLDQLRSQLMTMREGQVREAEEVKKLIRRKQEAQSRLEEEANLEQECKQELYREQAKREDILRELKHHDQEETATMKQLDQVKETLAQSPQRIR